MGFDFIAGIKSIVGKAAPILGNAILPGIGGPALSMIAKIFGCDPEPESVYEALKNATPEQVLAMKDMENKHEERLIELATEETKLHVENTKDARNREIEITKITGKRDINLYVLAWLVVLGFFGLMSLMIFVDIPETNIGPVNQLFGALAAGFAVVLAYFFGSSKSSSDKTKLMANKG